MFFFHTHTKLVASFTYEHMSTTEAFLASTGHSWAYLAVDDAPPGRGGSVFRSVRVWAGCGWKLHVSYEIDSWNGIEPPQKDRTTWIFLSVFVGFSWIFDLSFLSVALVVMGNLRWETQLSVAKKLMQRVTGTALFSHCTGCGTTWNDIWACLKIGFLSPIHGHFDQCMLLWGTLFWDESSWCMSKQDQQSPKRRMGWELKVSTISVKELQRDFSIVFSQNHGFDTQRTSSGVYRVAGRAVS